MRSDRSDRAERGEMAELAGLLRSASPPPTRREHLEGRARLIASVEKMRRPSKGRFYAMAVAGAVITVAVVAAAATRYWTRAAQDPLRLVPHERAAAASETVGSGGSTAPTGMSESTAPESVAPEVAAEWVAPEVAAPSAEKPAVSAAPSKTMTWRELVGRGDFKRVLREAKAAGFGHVLRTRPAPDLRALGDAVRYSGDEDLQARAVYESIRDRFPASDDAHIAAFVLGRLSEEHANRPDDAITWYSTYLREAPAGTFAGDALGRKMVLMARRSGKQQARPLANDYLRLYPHGPYEKPALEIAQPRETKGP